MFLRLVTLAVLGVVAPLSAQATRQFASGGEVVSRMSARVPGVPEEHRPRMRVGGDSAQRIALHDFAWKGRVISLEIDEMDSRLFWDVKIEPDSNPRAIIRYRVDATNGGIIGIREFAVARRRP
jgi:hypothetical protein